MLKFVIFLVVFGCATALTTPCRGCNSKGVKQVGPVSPPPTGTCQTVTIEPCTASPCSLKKGTNVTFSVTFTAGQNANTLTSEVYGIIANVPVPFPLPNPNGCKNSGITCPIVAGQTYTYTDQLFISSLYPSLNLFVKWSLVDESKKPIFCVVVPAKISG